MAREVDGFQYFSDDSEFEHAMVRSLDRTEQLGGALGPLFAFRMQPVGRRRRWRETVDHTQFHAHLEQPRDATPGDDIGVHLMEALYRAIRSQIAPNSIPTRSFTPTEAFRLTSCWSECRPRAVVRASTTWGNVLGSVTAKENIPSFTKRIKINCAVPGPL